MPTIIMNRLATRIDGSVRGHAMAFLEKLNRDDRSAALHIEPIRNSVDPRVRTGRVNDFWRAVLFQLEGSADRYYLLHGIWPHDKAITIAKRIRLKVNPVNTLPQIDEIEATQAPATMPDHRFQAANEPHLKRLGYRKDELVNTLGLPETIAHQAMTAPDESAVLDLAQRHGGWIGDILLDLAVGEPVSEIVTKLGLDHEIPTGQSDSDVLAALRRPAVSSHYAFIDDHEELRRVIESGDFGAWRIFLHPLQRRYVESTYRGAFRLTGGAGTGKTVVLVHRARALAQRNPAARIVLTTFTTTLADALSDSLSQLDPTVPQTKRLGEPGVCVIGVDALASAVIRDADSELSAAMREVLGDVRTKPHARTPAERWRRVLEASPTTLPREIANEEFLSTEYTHVVLPYRVRDEAAYLRAPRHGRGVALDHAKRSAVWKLIAAYRAESRKDGSLDFSEAAAVAAAYLARKPQRPADHVLVDEGQDLSPLHWQLLRALVPEKSDDLFIAEDSHQRIYNARVVLSHYGISTVGRSRRLTLNYRTTAQNLRYALRILEDGSYHDLEGEPEVANYRSVRLGPSPIIETVGSFSDELAAVVRHVRQWVDSGDKPETIGVLVRDRYHRDRVVEALKAEGVAAQAMERGRLRSGRVPVMTMHRSKGTEFTKVVLVPGKPSPGELERLKALDPALRSDVELRNRSLKYVAATRARDALVVIDRD